MWFPFSTASLNCRAVTWVTCAVGLSRVFARCCPSRRKDQPAPIRITITVGICDWPNGVQGSVCMTALPSRPCPLWVKSRHCGTSRQCPLYPQKRTSKLSRGTSALCQKQTKCAAANTSERVGNSLTKLMVGSNMRLGVSHREIIAATPES
jgi:hypothetical protein